MTQPASWKKTKSLIIPNLMMLSKNKNINNNFPPVKTKLRLFLKCLILTPPHISTSLCWTICITPHKFFCKEWRCNFYSRCSIVAATAMSWRCCVFPNRVRVVTFRSHAWGIRPITTHWIAGQSEHTSLFRTTSFVKIGASQKGATIIYGMWKIMCFLP